MTTRFQTYEGNIRALPFRLQRKGVKGPWNVSGATQIRFEWETPAEVVQTPIIASSAHPDADWTNGIVIAVITENDVTAAIGTYPFSLTVDIAGETITAAIGFVEVIDRPGYEP